jgi:putative transposase
MPSDELPSRKRPPHHPYIEAANRSNILLLTVCTRGRKPILARDKVHDLLITSWMLADKWLVGRYVILPDHMHLFCSPVQHVESKLRNWVSYWKAAVTRQWPYPNERSIWQKNFWDRQLRRGESYTAKWKYVQNNAVRHKLVDSSDDWPYQGEINEFRWHE